MFQIHFRDVLTFPPAFWLLSVVCLAYYVAIFPFISLGQVFFVKKFGFTTKDANFVIGKETLFFNYMILNTCTYTYLTNNATELKSRQIELKTSQVYVKGCNADQGVSGLGRKPRQIVFGNGLKLKVSTQAVDSNLSVAVAQESLVTAIRSETASKL